MIEAVGLTKRYGKKTAVDGISFTVKPGMVTGFLGPNGAGKSTLFKLIAGKEQPDSGQVIIGSTVRAAFVDQHRDELANQKTVWEDISNGLDIINVGKFQMPSRAYAGRFNFNGADQQKKVGTLSGGERGRLHLAKTLIAGGNVLMLDEPSMGLAPILVNEVFRIIERLKSEGVTMLLVEQFAAAALGVADYGYVLENGRISVHGPAEKLRDDPAVKAAYLGGSH